MRGRTLNIIQTGLSLGMCLAQDFKRDGHSIVDNRFLEDTLGKEMAIRMGELLDSRVGRGCFFGYCSALSLLSQVAAVENKPELKYWADLGAAVDCKTEVRDAFDAMQGEGEFIEKLIAGALIPGGGSRNSRMAISTTRAYNNFISAMKKTGVTGFFISLYSHGYIELDSVKKKMEKCDDLLEMNPASFVWSVPDATDGCQGEVLFGIDLLFFLVAVARKSIFAGFLGDEICIDSKSIKLQISESDVPVADATIYGEGPMLYLNKRFAPIKFEDRGKALGYLIPNEMELSFGGSDKKGGTRVSGLFYPLDDSDLYSKLGSAM